MTCHEMREYLIAFLDSELDAALSIEAQRHLERCHECAREVEIEREIRRGLERCLVVGQADAVDEGSLHALRHITGRADAEQPQTRFALRRRVGVALAAAALVALGLFGWQRFNVGERASPGGFAKWMVEDFQHFIDEGSEVQFASADQHAVSQWLLQKTTLAVNVPGPADREIELRGGRKCKLNGTPVAFAAYAIDGAPASLVALPDDGNVLNSMQSVRLNGHMHWVDHCNGHTVVACRRGELVYAAVGQLSEEQLLRLMPANVDETEGTP